MEEKIRNRMEKKKINHNLVKRSEEVGLSIRKKRLENFISAKRNLDKINENPDYQISLQELEIMDDCFDESYLEDITKLNDPHLITGLYYENTKMIKFGLFFIRKYLSLEKPNSKVIYQEFMSKNIEVIDKLCELLINSDKKIQFESSWILINLCSYFSQPVDRIIKIEKNFNNLMLFLHIQDYVLLEHGVWIINNISCDSSDSFQVIIKSGINERISELLTSKISLNFTLIIIHFFKNLERFKKDLHFKIHNKEFKPIIEIFNKSFNDKLIYECLEYFFFISLDFDFIDNIIMIDQLVLKFFEIARNTIEIEEDYRKKRKSLEVIGNLLCGNVIQTQRMINLGLLDLIYDLLDTNDVETIKYSLFCVSNIAGTSAHIQLLLNKGILTKVLMIYKEIMSTDSITIDADSFNYILLKECLYCICNCLDEGDKMVKMFFMDFELKIIESLLFSLKIFYNDSRLTFTILRTICFALEYENVGKFDKEYNIKHTLILNGFPDKLSEYTQSMNEEIRKYSQWLADKLELREVNSVNIQIEN